MNILPKKRWHVRTKDNIARVRRDEAEAREKEEKRLQKLKFAESEARINFLRRQSGIAEKQESTEALLQNSEHIDLFADYKTHVKATNKDLENEQKTEREKYEKQIGYLTYLGQDTNEALKLRSWYEIAPRRSSNATNVCSNDEKDFKNKFTLDPLTLINALLPNEDKSKKSKKESSIIVSSPKTADNKNILNCEAECVKQRSHKKYKKEKKSKKDKKSRKEKKTHSKKQKKRKEKIHKSKEKQQQKLDLLERLRKERLKREEMERARQDALLNTPETAAVEQEKKANANPRVIQKYNSQFNPEFAKQNMY